MKLPGRTFKWLGEIITGHKGPSPYRAGPKLVRFFNEFGTNHTCGQGFSTRWMFAEDCLRQFNDTPVLSKNKKIILSALDPRDFMGATVFDKENSKTSRPNPQDALTYLPEFMAHNGA
jgi:hypothetical protein